MAEHAPLPPSGSEQWANCPGSVAAQASIPDRETQKSREGTAAHWVMASALLLARAIAQAGQPVPAINCEDWVGSIAPNGVVIDPQMAEGAQVIVDDVLELARRFDAVAHLLIEERVAMPQIHPDNWGTLDVGLYLPAVSCLFVWDYKHGHREVSPVDNLQEIDYALGLCNRFGITGADELHLTFVGRIVQPFSYSNAGPVKEWRAPLVDLRAHWNRLEAAAREVYSNPTMTAGRWCRDCKAVRTCSTARRYGYRMIDCANEAPEVDAMVGPDKTAERQILQDGLAVIKARLESLEEDLVHSVSQGDTTTGLALETSQGRQKWSRPASEVLAVLRQLGVDASKPTAQTPREVRKAAPKEVRPALDTLFKTMTRRDAGALKLIPAGESRTALAFKRK